MNIELNPIQLIQKYCDELEQLRKKSLAARKDLVEQYHYDIAHDYRITIFEQIDRLLIYHDINVVLFLRYIMHPQYVSDLFCTSEQDSIRIASDYLKRSRHALIIFIQSVIESYYRALCAAFALTTSIKFSSVYDSLFNRFNVSTDSELYKANKILTKIRNTLHNNGIHTMSDDTINYHGKEYVFSQNLPHQAAGYDTIIHIISDLIDFLHLIGSESYTISFVDNNGFVDYKLV
ncbi:MAG: hypothetical protein K2H33_00220 [Muribaculaceae bacterium]|nr:hypothetical protein [Muribaculaceae bacterium]